MTAAEVASKLSDRDRTLAHLREAMRHAEAYDALPQGRQNFTCVTVPHASIAVETGTKSYTESETEITKKVIREETDGCFDFLRDDEEFCKLLG